MKKTHFSAMAVILIMLMAINVSAAYPANDMVSYGQETVPVYIAATPPVMDGKVNNSEYNEAIRILKYGDRAVYFGGTGFSDAEIKDLVPEEFILYAAYDSEYFYMAATNNDTNHFTPLTGTGVWDGDYLEFDIGTKVSADWTDMTDKIRLAIGYSSTDNSAFTYTALNTTYSIDKFEDNTGLDGIGTVSVANGLTTYEARIPWSYITSDGKALASAFFYYQLGISDSDYADRSEYEAYLGVYRYAVLQSDEMKAETNTGVIAHIMKFSGDAPEPEVILAETPSAPAAETIQAAVETPSAPVTAAQTSDMTTLSVIGLLTALSIALVITKKQIQR